MPMIGSLANRIREFHGGDTYAKTKARKGAKTANAQAVAAAYSSMRSIGDVYKRSRKK